MNDEVPTFSAAPSVRFLVYEGFQILDLAGPMAAFEVASRFLEVGYRVEVVSMGAGPARSSVGMDVSTARWKADSPCDTLVVVGGYGAFDAAADLALLARLAAAAAGARRISSVCSGALILAAAGLLDGRRATTHWRLAAALQKRFPSVRVEADRIFVQDGAIWTSAGISAGIDLAIALIEADQGAELAAKVARELVVYHRRSGGQSQFSTLLELAPSGEAAARALAFARERLDEDLSVERLAQAVALSPRQFSRRFRAETGQSPAKAVERLRVEAARAQVETGRQPMEQVARRNGFGDPERMRRAFLRTLGHPPQALRREARR